MAWSDAARKAAAEARRAKAKGSAAKRQAVAQYSKGRIAATIGNESMRMRPKLTPEQSAAAVRAAGERAQRRKMEALRDAGGGLGAKKAAANARRRAAGKKQPEGFWGGPGSLTPNQRRNRERRG